MACGGHKVWRTPLPEAAYGWNSKRFQTGHKDAAGPPPSPPGRNSKRFEQLVVGLTLFDGFESRPEGFSWPSPPPPPPPALMALWPVFRHTRIRP